MSPQTLYVMSHAASYRLKNLNHNAVQPQGEYMTVSVHRHCWLLVTRSPDVLSAVWREHGI